MKQSTDANDEGPPVSQHETLAKQNLPPGAYAYFFGGSGLENGLQENTKSFQRIRLRPRMLRNVRSIDTKCQLLSTLPILPYPLLITPMALQTLAHPNGEIAVSSCGIPMVLSMLCGIGPEQVKPLLQQIYVLRDKSHTLAIAQRAKRAGARGLVLTVDAPVLGRRLRDEQTSFTPPSNVHPAYLAHLNMSHRKGASAIAKFIDTNVDPDLTPNTIKWLAKESGLPVWVKGILRPDDACIAVNAGAVGIMVSNHGGRQLDSAIAPVDALPSIVEAVGNRVPVVLDSGVRTGEDVVKALALGAKAVMIGRPVMASLAADGERGVRRLLTEFTSDIRRAMALCGATSLRDIDRTLIATSAKL